MNDSAPTVVCDGLLPWHGDFLPPGADLARMLDRYIAAGFGHVSITVAAGTDTAEDALAAIGRLQRQLVPLADRVRLVDGADDLRRTAAEGVFSVGLHFQTSTPLHGDPDTVDAFRALGVNRAILAYNQANLAADGCHEPRNGGLTALGRALVQRMADVGMIVDLSHCGERTSLEAMELCPGRVVFSHSNARALFGHERNITDEQIRACAARGGFIGVNGVGFFLGADAAAIPGAVADHIAHIAAIAGADHVGLGLDYMYLDGSDHAFFHRSRERWPRGYPPPPWRFLQPEQLEELVSALGQRGFGADETAGILGGNYVRLSA